MARYQGARGTAACLAALFSQRLGTHTVQGSACAQTPPCSKTILWRPRPSRCSSRPAADKMGRL
eukprot:scaffold91909_cov75-Phaeocystis_antarctica.AAC.2